MYGTQAQHSMYWEQSVFENDVKMYGTQANSIFQYDTGSLRMM